MWQDGCAVAALVPALVHQPWWHDLVMHADAIHYVRRKLAFTNPFLDVNGTYFYSFVLVVWESTRATAPPRWVPLERPTDSAEEREALRVRRCTGCGKYRLLPRHQSEPAVPFTCAALADETQASCAAPCPVWRWDV